MILTWSVPDVFSSSDKLCGQRWIRIILEPRIQASHLQRAGHKERQAQSHLEAHGGGWSETIVHWIPYKARCPGYRSTASAGDNGHVRTDTLLMMMMMTVPKTRYHVCMGTVMPKETPVKTFAVKNLNKFTTYLFKGEYSENMIQERLFWESNLGGLEGMSAAWRFYILS